MFHTALEHFGAGGFVANERISTGFLFFQHASRSEALKIFGRGV
jgi:hypothetical protein